MLDSSRKLLIVDDDAIVRHSVVAYLEDTGFCVFQAADGPAALRLFYEVSPDLIVCDLRMPGMDGLQVLREVHEHAPDVPVIVISGAGVMGDVVEALRLGASDYLIKPVVDMEVLVHSVRKSLERRDLLAQNQKYREELERTNRDLEEHLQVLERDQEAGREVQRKLLPPTSFVARDYKVAQRIVPSLYLSGDFIDYGYMAGRYLAFYLSDVAGHGASSAFVTVWLKNLVNRMTSEEGLFTTEKYFESGPTDMLSKVNKELLRSGLGRHLTCFVGVIDTHTNRFSYSVAGHLPMPIMVTEEGVKYLEGRGKPVGIFASATWTMYQVDLPDRFHLMSFSDGILEILPREDLPAQEEYLLNLVNNYPTMATLCKALDLDSVHEAPDDIAILSVSRGL